MDGDYMKWPEQLVHIGLCGECWNKPTRWRSGSFLSPPHHRDVKPDPCVCRGEVPRHWDGAAVCDVVDPHLLIAVHNACSKRPAQVFTRSWGRGSRPWHPINANARCYEQAAMRTGSRHPGDLVTNHLETLHDTRRVRGHQLEYHGAIAGSPIRIGEDAEYVYPKVLDFTRYLGQDPCPVRRPDFDPATGLGQPNEHYQSPHHI